MSKYYAVKEGHNPGIYTDWPTTQEQVKGYSGAVYKSFKSLEEAESFLGVSEKDTTPAPDNIPNGEMVIYTDGSFNEKTNTYGYGYTIQYEDLFIEGFGGENDPVLADMCQVSGEIIAATTALRRGIRHDPESISIHYDYKGVEEWATGGWSANKAATQYYADEMKRLIKLFGKPVTFVKTKAHSGVEGNEYVDQLAKKGAGIS